MPLDSEFEKIKPKLTLEQLKEIADLTEKKEQEIIKAKNPENQEIEMNLESERQYWQKFYENHNFKDKVDIPEIHLKEEQIKEIQTLIEQGFVDKCAVIPDHLTYAELEPEMSKGYEETYQGSNFKQDGSFATLDEQEQAKQPAYRLVFYKKVQNLEDDKILKQTRGKSPDEMDEYLKETNKKLNTDIQGISLKDYLITQREFTETTNPDKNIQDKSRHMDEAGWNWCLKSRFKKSGRVVDANDSSNSYSNNGSRLSRSFVMEK